MSRTSIRWFHLCATLFLAGLVFCAVDAVAQDKDKKVVKDKKADDKDK